MPKVKLTDKFIRGVRYEDGKGQIDYCDTGLSGLSLRVTNKGKKVFTLRYAIKGQRKRYTIGPFGDHQNQYLLKDARNRASELLVRIRNGDDPAVERAQSRKKEESKETVSDTFELYLTRLRRRGRRESYLYDVTKRFQLHAEPVIGKMPTAEVKKSDISKILRPLELDGKLTTHNRVLTILRSFFDMAEVDNPTAKFEKLPENPKEDWFTVDQLADIWITLDHSEAKVHPITALSIRLAMLTLKRAGEVAGAKVAEIEGDLWHIPASRMKGKRPEVVPLSPQAMKIIDETLNHPYRRNDCAEFLFTSLTKSNASIERNALSRAFPRTRRLAGLEGHAGSLHSIRHSGATILASKGTSPYIVSALLSHALTSAGVSRVTSRYNMYDLLSERREALEIWGELLLAAVKAKIRKKRHRNIRLRTATSLSADLLRNSL